MRRIYFLLPDLETTRAVVRELLLNHVEERNIHIVARDQTPLEDLPSASEWQKTDLVPALEKGATVGGATGAIAGLVAVTVPSAGLLLGGAAVLGLAIAGAGFGAWAASMIGISAPNSQLRKFHDAIEAGQLLMLVDVPRRRVDAVEERIRQQYGQVEIQGTEPNIPNWP